MTTTAAAVARSSYEYAIDTKASQFTVQAFADGLISVVAHSPKIAIREWQAEIRAADSNLKGLSMKVRVRPTALDVLDDLRDADRRKLHKVLHDEVLEINRYPEILFESSDTQVETISEHMFRLIVRGTLTFHGVCREHFFLAQASLWEDGARAHGSFSVRQSDYNIAIASIAGGTLKLQDELKFSFYAIVRKKS